ncbi:hypothetical protein K439DRAFT_211103 [Ramaria rubella]|nr:hypothetical protein K439DRAFT_211103 [Ramaria rubella]
MDIQGANLLDRTWGAILIGVFISIFYGISTLQMYVYFQRYPVDPHYFKSVVGVIWGSDTFHTICITHMMYTIFISDFGDHAALGKRIWSFNLHIFTTTIVASISQVFLVHRCWILDKGTFNTVMSIIALIPALVQLVFGTICTFLTFRLTRLPQFLRATDWVMNTWLGATTACDILVSVIILRSLWPSRQRHPTSLVEQFILWTVNTGIITSVCVVVDLALFNVSTEAHSYTHNIFNVMVAKLYVNTLLATLNSRRPTRREDDEDSTNETSPSVPQFYHTRHTQQTNSMSYTHSKMYTNHDVDEEG